MTTYYAHVNSHDELTKVDMSLMIEDSYGSTNVQNIEVSETVFKHQKEYMFKNGKIVKNPNYPIEQLKKAKTAKYEENSQKAKEARYSKKFTVTLQEKECEFDTSEETQRDLLTAFDVCSSGITYDGWITNNGVEIDLTLEDILIISATFKEKSSVYGQWNAYKTAIDNASTVEEVERITINYVN
ncbi:MAG: DUF4376 domain-containing protein [Clostridiales bacterium]|nr:DUF4376 domain-containing protein [Clostridiales bacterium]